MSKFRIMYEVEAYDINSALNIAHSLLFTQEVDVTNVKVDPVESDPGQTFGDIVEVETYSGENILAKAEVEEKSKSYFDKIFGMRPKL